MKKANVCMFFMILIGTSLFSQTKPPSTTVSLGAQMGTITSGTAETATFMVSTKNVADGTTGSIAWYTSLAATTTTAAPTGITAAVSVISSNAAMLAMIATPSAVAGSCYFTVTFGSTNSSGVALTIAPKEGLQIWVYLIIFMGAILFVLSGFTAYLVGTGKLTGKDWISNSFGLPDGSVRALIALLFLLVIVLAATGHINLADLPSWATGIVGTIVGFYFGAQTVSSAQQQQKQTASISTASLPKGQVGKAYTANMSAVGLTPPLTWSAPKAVMPAGLLLDPATGAISGTPNAANTFNITFAVTDNAGNGATKDLSITIEKKNP